MIIDRIFSLVNKRALEPKWGEKIANARYIKHHKYSFERQDDGSFLVESIGGSNSLLQDYFYEIHIMPINGTYKLVGKLNRDPIIYADIFLSLALAYSIFASIAIGYPLFLIIYQVLLGAITLQQKGVMHFIFIDLEYALYKAEYIGNL